MLKFKRVLRMGAKGPDVAAVKIGLRRAGHGRGLRKDRHFGQHMRARLKEYQHSVGLTADGVYGEKTHEHLRTHFTPFARWLYRRTKVQPTDVTKLSARQAALRLLHYHAEGRYRDDSGRDLAQVIASSEGLPVINAIGQRIYIDKRVFQALCLLIERGYRVGTFAFCSDHFYESALGHGGGHAVDISSIDGESVASSVSEGKVLEVARLLNGRMPASLHPWQLICDGCGYEHVSAISAETIPGAWFYGATTMSQHRNHIHLGYE